MATQTDIVVIGGGLAGLSAALRSAELGLQVTLLEKGDGERYPCNSRYSGGIIHICFLDIRHPPEELLAAIRRATSDDVSMPLPQTTANHASRYVDWLQQHGARFMRFSMLKAHRWCMAPPRALGPGMDWQGRGPDVLLRKMMEQFLALGGNVQLNTTASQLMMNAGRYVGVVAKQAGGDKEFAAKAVLIADDGFQSNRDMFVENIGPNFEGVLQRGAATGCGDGLKMAAAAGAQLTKRQRFYGHLLCRDALTNEKVWPYPEVDIVAVSGLVIGPDGRRLTDEGGGGISIANALARLPDPTSAMTIFDSAIWDGPGKSARIPANPFLEKAGGTVHRADSIEALAALVKVPADALAATIASHNDAVARGDLSKLTPPRSPGTIKAHPIQTEPFMAIPLVPGITYTMGGIAIDGNGRVLLESGSAIDGLFAAGATTGGLEGGGDLGYVGGLAKAGVFGMVAAEQMAEAVKQH
jgi:fumarate reductase flavoprotein subunit